MKKGLLTMLAAALVAGTVSAQEVVFQDDFSMGLAPGWNWVREHPGAWRTGPRGLEIRVEPGNMWGGENSARNVLVRPLPSPEPAGLELSVTFQNKPTEQYEQADLVWYYADSHMVKIGQELVDGQLSVVMGREEGDRTRTIAIIPLKTDTVSVRFRYRNGELEGAFRPDGAADWTRAGACDLPILEGKPAQVSLQAYQGPAQVERWVRITKFQIVRLAE